MRASSDVVRVIEILGPYRSTMILCSPNNGMAATLALKIERLQKSYSPDRYGFSKWINDRKSYSAYGFPR